MDLAGAITSRLKAAGAVTALVGNRIYWLRREQNSGLPALVLTQVSGVSEGDTLEGEGPVWSSRVQVDCFANGPNGFSTARRIAKAARAALVEPGAVDGFEMLGADSSGPIDFTEDTAGGSLFRASIDLLIRHGEED